MYRIVVVLYNQVSYYRGEIVFGYAKKLGVARYYSIDGASNVHPYSNQKEMMISMLCSFGGQADACKNAC